MNPSTTANSSFTARLRRRFAGVGNQSGGREQGAEPCAHQVKREPKSLGEPLAVAGVVEPEERFEGNRAGQRTELEMDIDRFPTLSSISASGR